MQAAEMRSLLLTLLAIQTNPALPFAVDPPTPPPPPWSFEASRVHYQFLSVPADVARKCIPFHRDDEDDSLCLLSIGGHTLGGLFAIEYTSSPVGPYREIAVLAGLVTEKTPVLGVGMPDLFRVGAWASHIFVDSNDAAEYGRKFWGLPASVLPVEFDLPPALENDWKRDEDYAGPSFAFSDDKVGVVGWSQASSTLGKAVGVTLPSYSGRLSPSDPLLRYPLTVSNIGSISAGKASASVIPKGASCDENLRLLLEESRPLLSFDVGGAKLIAGVPSVI